MKAKPKRLGQLCLVVALVINGVLLLVNMRQTSLEDGLSRKRSAERYFILNQQAISAEDTKRALLHTSLNQLKMLRRLVRDKLSERENEILVNDERELQRQINASYVKVVSALYLQANDPPPGQHPDTMFSDKSDTELEALLAKFEEQAFRYAQGLKGQAINLTEKIAFWKTWNSVGLVAGMVILVFGNIIIFAVDTPDESQATRRQRK